ncbi:MAG: SLC13 family permease [Patescibacteria group bacterium]
MSILEMFSSLTTDQLIIFTVIGLVMVLLVSRTMRYDMISIFALIVVFLTGVIPVDKAFSGMIHPVVLLVIAMFIITRGLSNSGLIDYITRKIGIFDKHPAIQIMVLVSLVAFASAFINNIGALAPIIPVAIHLARKNDLSPSIFLLPLAFGSQLGGYLTLIGTPRNIIVSAFREEAGSGPFAMFDFAPVGIGLAIIGILFISFVGWRLIPKRKDLHLDEPFAVENYVTELNIPENSTLVGEYVGSIKDLGKKDIKLISLIRDGVVINNVSGYEIIKPKDHLLVKADSKMLKNFSEEFRLNLVGEKAVESQTPEDERGSIEMVVNPLSPIIGKKWDEIPLSMRYGTNLLAVSRTGSQIQTPLNELRFRPGDIVLLHGKIESVQKAISNLGGYPLAERDVTFGQKNAIPFALTIFILAILTATLTTAPVEAVFIIASFIMVATNLVSLKQAYESIQWPVIILIGSMITLGIALQETGGADVAASFIVSHSDVLAPSVLVALVLIISIFLANFINATVSAVVMAPIAIFVASELSVSIDPFLMAVAVGATSVFLTPFGHESNTLVLEAGGYSFKDYLKVGLPLEVLIIATAIPLILYFWPL